MAISWQGSIRCTAENMIFIKRNLLKMWALQTSEGEFVLGKPGHLLALLRFLAEVSI